jgi:DNA modification methylase
MALNDNDRRDVIKLIESNKPLPDKYRFLLFEEKKEVELVWNGKTGEVTNIVLPFQTIEEIDEPREESNSGQQNLLPQQGQQSKGWKNKLIWGDNKLILSSLKNGPLRKEIEDNGGIKLIYIDPPFDVGADFSMDIEIGDEQFTKEPTVLEELAYRDTWGKGADSFISMIYERLSLMHDLLSNDGSIYVHCDYRVSAYIKNVLDEIFGEKLFINEIIFKSTDPKSLTENSFSKTHQTLYLYAKSSDYKINPKVGKVSENALKEYSYFMLTNGEVVSSKEANGRPGRYFKLENTTAPSFSPNRIFEWYGYTPRNGWRYSKEKLDQMLAAGEILLKNNLSSSRCHIKFLDEIGDAIAGTIWSDLGTMKGGQIYPTQKTESLLERIIKASSSENSIIADFFCGSGTTLAVAEKLGRKWIGTDLGKFAIHTTRKRMIGVQRELKAQGKDFRPFEILNLGKYERQAYTKKETDFINLIIRAYKAQNISSFKTLCGKKVDRLVAIGPIDFPVTRPFIEDVIEECKDKQITKVDVLAFEFEMGLLPAIIDEAKNQGVDLSAKHIPREVFDKRAVEAGQVTFYNVAYLEIKPIVKDGTLAVELVDFSVYYNQDTEANIEALLQNGSSKVYVRDGKIIKITKDKNGVETQEVLTKKWTDWIDYWSVDFNFESKKELIWDLKDDSGEQIRMDGMTDPKQLKFKNYIQKETGNFVFENEWQSFRTKKNRNLELTSTFKQCPKGRRKIAVKVVDIFGNDTTKVIEVNI